MLNPNQYSISRMQCEWWCPIVQGVEVDNAGGERDEDFIMKYTVKPVIRDSGLQPRLT